MIQYLIILLDDAATSYCSYSVNSAPHQISIDTLKAGIRYAMCENWMIQFVYPPFDLSDALKAEIETIDHHRFLPAKKSDGDADLIIFNSAEEFQTSTLNGNKVYALRTDKRNLFVYAGIIAEKLKDIKRLNIILTDVETFGTADFDNYKKTLDTLVDAIAKDCRSGMSPQLNLLTDRLTLKAMNNCGAGENNITLAPDGKFYICPAFYYDKTSESIGDLASGLDMKNPQLYRLERAPLCRRCDAYQCRRCIYLNKKTTLEVNTPSHEQCVVAHLERNASRRLQEKLMEQGILISGEVISEIDYLDPFDIKNIHP